MVSPGQQGGKSAFPSRPSSLRTVQARLARALREDWDYRKGRIFGSMCTQPLPWAERLAQPFATANTGNPGLCPGTVRLEEELMAWLLDLFHAPSFGAGGTVVTGGTEGNITALWIARNVSGLREVVVPRSAHFSVAKALDLLSLKPRWAKTSPDGVVRVEEVRRLVSSRTAAVIAMAGSTELGAVDPIPELSEWLEPRGVRLHVDAAFGGFILPFLREIKGTDLPFDFKLPGVTSLSVDPHKMGGAPIPSGALLLRNWEEAQSIMTDSPYLSTPRSIGLFGTRPSRNVASTYAAIAMMGRTGYVRQLRRALQLTHRIAEEGRRLGIPAVREPSLNLVVLQHPNPQQVQLEMLRRGWDISAIREPRGLRFVVMPHVTAASVKEMLIDLTTVVRSKRRQRFPS